MKFVVNLAFLPKDAEEAARCIAPFIEAMIQANMVFLSSHKVPNLYNSGVVYQEDAAWRDTAAMLKKKTGSCHSLVAWRIAELRLCGEQAKIHIQFTKKKNVEWFHVQVKRLFPKPHVEDPSRKTGMRF